jgi:SCY1-like protein 1
MALGTKTKAQGIGHLTSGQSTLLAELESELAAETGENDAADAWDDEPYGAGFDRSEQEKDLMDVNADQDDWSKCSSHSELSHYFFLILNCSNSLTVAAFESAPPPSIGIVSPAIENVWTTKSTPVAYVAVRSVSPAPSSSDNPWSNSGEDISAAFSKPATYPSLSTQSILQPKPASAVSIIGAKSSFNAPAPADDGWGAFGEGEAVVVENSTPATPSAAQSPSGGGSMAGMSKEEKAAEMTRRKEERKAVSLVLFNLFHLLPFSLFRGYLLMHIQCLRLLRQRIAQLKEQKKGGA